MPSAEVVTRLLQFSSMFSLSSFLNDIFRLKKIYIVVTAMKSGGLQMDGFSLVVEFHRGGPATNGEP